MATVEVVDHRGCPSHRWMAARLYPLAEAEAGLELGLAREHAREAVAEGLGARELAREVAGGLGRKMKN